MADSTNANPGCNLVAIDIARYSNAVLIETAVGKRHRFRMANTAPVLTGCYSSCMVFGVPVV